MVLLESLPFIEWIFVFSYDCLNLPLWLCTTFKCSLWTFHVMLTFHEGWKLNQKFDIPSLSNLVDWRYTYCIKDTPSASLISSFLYHLVLKQNAIYCKLSGLILDLCWVQILLATWCPEFSKNVFSLEIVKNNTCSRDPI